MTLLKKILSKLITPTIKGSVDISFMKVAMIKRQSPGLDRRVISSQDTVENQTTIGTIGRNELDTHADTGVAGVNWRVIEFTGDQVEVQPYSKEYEAIRNIPIAKCATVWTNPETGQELLLLADQMLWFGSRLDHSLLNPNQIQEYGLKVYDDPIGEESLRIASRK